MALTLNRTRSPKYPNYSLRTAIKRVAKIHAADRRNVIERINAANHMGYSSLSGPSEKAIGTLVQYGLLDIVDKGRVRVSQLAVDILHPDSEPQYKAAILKAAYQPDIFKSLKERFPEGVSESSLKSYLVRENFMDRAIAPITKAYSDTSAFLEQCGAIDSGGHRAEEVGESDSFGDENAPPMDQSTPAHHALHAVPITTAPPVLGMPKIAIMYEGEREWLRGPLSREASYRLIVTGDLGPKEIGKLIKLLEAQRSVLEDDEEDFSDLA